MGRVIPDIEIADRLKRDALSFHLVDQRGQAVGEIIKVRPRRNLGVGLQQLFDQSRKLEAAGQPGLSRGCAGIQFGRKVLNDRDPWQEPRPRLRKHLPHPARHAPGVDD